MAYRNGTYVAFHAAGSTDPTASDMKYYNLLKAWHVRPESEFFFINSHDKASAVRDSSSRDTLRRSLTQRLLSSKNMILILGDTTRFDTDWVPFEISYAIDECQIPVIAAYPGYQRITTPGLLASVWPSALSQRIASGAAHVIHVPFKRAPLTAAVSQFDHHRYPNGGGHGIYSPEAYAEFERST
jgi:hypothetical protein